MKKLSLIILFILLSINFIYADIPYLINYRGNLLENDSPVTGTKSINFQIYNVPSGSAPLWESEAKSLNVINGAIAYTLGLDNPSAFSNINWKSQPIYLQIVVEGNPLLPRERIGSVGYSMVAQEALFVSSSNVDLDGVSGKKLSDWVTNSGRIKGSKIDGIRMGNSLDSSDGNPKNNVYVSTNGFVGIGSSSLTNPLTDLHIKGNSWTYLLVEADGNNEVAIALRNQAGGDWIMYVDETFDNGALKFSHGNDFVTIATSGNVRIGTGTASEKLEVDGNVKANSFIGDGSGLTNIASGGAKIFFINSIAFDGTAPTSWTVLDLSSIVGTKNALVLLKVEGLTDPKAFRQNGYNYDVSVDASFHGVNLAYAMGAGIYHSTFVTTDSTGKIEWMSSTGSANTKIYIIAYIANE